MSIMQDFEEARKIIGPEKYDAIEKYLDEVCPKSNYDKYNKELNSMLDYSTDEWLKQKKELEEKFGASKKTQSEPKTPTKTDTVDEPVKQKKEPVKITKEDKKEMDAVHKDLSKAATEQIPYRFPSLDLLNKPKSNGKLMDNSELRATAAKLQSTLDSFGVRVKMGDISLGPSVTRYELIPEQGVKVSRITGLSDDIKLSLAASDIRIEAPIFTNFTSPLLTNS